jgi:chromate transporter
MSIGVAVVIFDAVTTMTKTVLGQKKFLPIILMILAFIVTLTFELHIVYILLSCAIAGMIATLVASHKGKKR